MKYTGTYALVLALHLLTVAFLVGPSALSAMASARYARAGQGAALCEAARTTRLYTLLTALTVVLGTGLVGLGDIGDQWGLGQLWVSASYALWFVAVGLTLGLVVPTQLKAAQAAEDGTDSAGLAGRLAMGAGLSALAWSAIIVLMVTKPGA